LTGGRALVKRTMACSRSCLLSVMSWSPVASRGSRWFISSLAHCSRLSVSRPLYLERSAWSVPISMTAPMSDAASGVSLYLVRGEG
jgi:hypothetical protein